MSATSPNDLFADISLTPPVVGLPPTEINNRFVQLPEEGWRVYWAWLSERANPIVVKEARQALNSKQFTISFSLTLIAVICWTLLAVVIQLPSLYYVPGGMLMLAGFMVILSFPMLLIIPFSAFRSMIIESEERTFELVSISALSARQIVNGKMASALLQTIIYLATLTPCFVITYLLRGVLLSSILYYLIFTLLLSVTLTAVSILVASIGRAKLLQVISSIALLAGLLFAAFTWSMVTVNTLVFWDFAGWGLNVVIGVTMLTCTLVPFCLISATAAIDFPSENHATALRIRLTIFLYNCLGWGMWIALAAEEDEACYTFICVGLALFLLVGSFVVSENGIISPRAQRTLPRTVVGRIFGTWFFPGAGLGYVYMCCMFTGWTIAWIALALLAPNFQMRINETEQIIAMSLLCWLYFLFYNGLARLLMLAIPKTVSGRMVMGFLLQAILVLAGVAVPMIVISLLNGFRQPDYGWHQFPNIVWTIGEVSSTGIASVAPSFLLLALFAIPIFGLNLLLCGRDVLLVRIHVPGRLKEEIQANQPEPPATPDPFA